MASGRPSAVLFAVAAVLLLGSCASYRYAASAEEYYSLGSAYFDLGKYAEAEKWFSKAAKVDKTRRASEYNLGRIAFELGRYTEAAEIFESLIRRDPENTPALKGAAYSWIKAGDPARAEGHYAAVVALVPESDDSRYNYALVLHALQKYSEAEAVLRRMNAEAGDDRDALALLARTERALGKPEAIDLYARLAESDADPAILMEYAETAEAGGFYARAVEAYRRILQAGAADASVRFRLARAGLLGDPTDAGYLAELSSALDGGFKDSAALRALADDERLPDETRRSLESLIEDINAAE